MAENIGDQPTAADYALAAAERAQRDVDELRLRPAPFKGTMPYHAKQAVDLLDTWDLDEADVPESIAAAQAHATLAVADELSRLTRAVNNLTERLTK